MNYENEQTVGIRKTRSLLVSVHSHSKPDLRDTKVYSDYPENPGTKLLAIVPLDKACHPYLMKRGKRVTIPPKECSRCHDKFWRFTGDLEAKQCPKCKGTKTKIASHGK